MAIVVQKRITAQLHQGSFECFWTQNVCDWWFFKLKRKSRNTCKPYMKNEPLDSSLIYCKLLHFSQQSSFITKYIVNFSLWTTMWCKQPIVEIHWSCSMYSQFQHFENCAGLVFSATFKVRISILSLGNRHIKQYSSKYK